MSSIPPNGPSSNGFGHYEVQPAAAPQEAPPAGPCLATCVAVVDLGSHVTEGKDDKGIARARNYRRVYFGFELARQSEVSGTPFYLGRGFNISFAPSAALRKFLGSWRGHDIRDKEIIHFPELLGRACTLTVKHRQGQSRRFAGIDGIALPMTSPDGKPLPLPPLIRQPFLYEIGAGPLPDLSWIPWIYFEPAGKSVPLVEVIQASPEWKAVQQRQQQAT